MEGDDRSRLHEIVDGLSEEELPVARQLLELLARGLATSRPTVTNGTDEGALDALDDLLDGDADDDDDEATDDADDPLSSPATIAKLAQLTDDELLRLDVLLETDREAARRFWRERFGEELEDDPDANGTA